MTWVQAHPPGTTSVASTKTQFQQNNLYIENTLQADHYFDDATASNDGHHKYVQMPLQGADPGVAIAGGGSVFVKNSNAFAEPTLYFQNSSATWLVPVAYEFGNFVCNTGTTNTANFAALPKFRGYIYIFDTADFRAAVSTSFYWDGVTFSPNYRNSGKGQLISDTSGKLVQITSNGSTFVPVITTANITVNISIIGFFP